MNMADRSVRLFSQDSLALVALLTLITSYPDHPTPAIARAIVAHLQVVSRDERHDVELSRCVAELVSKWDAF